MHDEMSTSVLAAVPSPPKDPWPGTAPDSGAPPSGPLRPLTRTRKDDGTPYTREPAVEAQLRTLVRLGEAARRERLAVADRNDSGFVREEALVYLLREHARRGEDAAAWDAVDLLAQRITGHVRRELGRWRLSPEDRDECTRDLFLALCEALFDTGPDGEFWEVRFWVCLDRRLWNLAQKRQQAVDKELRQADRGGNDGEERGDSDDPLARLADTDLGPERRAELGEALRLLTENERLATYLCIVEGWPEESEKPDQPSAARALGVTGRTIRNYLRSAKAKLRAWERGEAG
jgi:DNA-directed RNA polymerase specialized sigma24 family protein